MIKTEEMKNIKKFLSLNKLNESRPKISLKLNLLELAARGGVFGNVKLKTPKTNEAMAVIKKVFLRSPLPMLPGSSSG